MLVTEKQIPDQKFNMDNSVLKKLQLTQLETLKVIDQVCRQYRIRYSLYAGTLLGAARHGGFIPWDDDLDICMPRDDYNRFLALWPETGPEGYILQNKDNTPDFTQSFTKIRKDHTTFLQSKKECGKYHTGIFVDIFPIDRLPNNKLSRYGFYWDCVRYQLFTREFVPPKSGRIVKMVSAVLLISVPKKRRAVMRKRLLKRIIRYSSDTTLNAVAIETINSMRVNFPPDLLDNYTEIKFEDGEFMCFADLDELLKRMYGDYMQLPPEKDRVWKHHPILIDFEHNYEELI